MYTNKTGIPLALAVWLARDEYDHNDKAISATGLIRPLKQIVLGTRVPAGEEADIKSVIAARIGTSIHNAIEQSWVSHYEEAMAALGYPAQVIDRVKINPDPKDLEPNDLPIYLELRTQKDIMGHTISGKFDFVGEGRVQDFKTTSAFTYINKSNDEKYILQGSIYRWLNPEIITSNTMSIQFVFLDWSQIKANIDPKYPQSRCLQYDLPLKSLAETESYIKTKLSQIDRYISYPEQDIPECTSEDLWRKAPVFKYYKNPAKLTRSTKNFDNIMDANNRLATDKNVGIVKEVKGEVVACRYCPALTICKQKNNYILDGTLKL
jgi:hypothetical protein